LNHQHNFRSVPTCPKQMLSLPPTLVNEKHERNFESENEEKIQKLGRSNDGHLMWWWAGPSNLTRDTCSQ
jgi:hypothetical protein